MYYTPFVKSTSPGQNFCMRATLLILCLGPMGCGDPSQSGETRAWRECSKRPRATSPDAGHERTREEVKRPRALPGTPPTSAPIEGRVIPAGSRATRLGEHDGSGGTVTPAGSCATRLSEHDGMTNICMYIPSLLSIRQDGVDQPWRRLHTPKQVDMHNPSKQERC